MKAIRLISCALSCAVFLFGPLAPLRGEGQSVEDLYMAADHVSRADQYLAMTLWDEAEKEYWQAVSLDYDNVKARQGLGDVYRRKQMYDRAIENVQIVLKSQPNNVDIQYLISLSYYDNHQYEQARLAAEKALQMNPELAKAENLVRLSEAKKRDQDLELQLLRTKEAAALDSFRLVQEAKSKGFVGYVIPGWWMIQTGEPKTMRTGYMILGTTAGLFLGGYMLRSSGQKFYDQAVTGSDRPFYQDRVNIGQSRYKAGGYMIDAALGMFFLNMADSFILKGKIFGGRTRVKPSLPDRDRHNPY